MRPNRQAIIKGVATMKFVVAFFLALSVFTSGILLGQTPPRGTGSSASKPRNETLKICQGVPVPDGYVIIAYMTSSACQHGAYLLKKQADYENALGVNKTAGKPTGDAGASATADRSSMANARPQGTSGPGTRKSSTSPGLAGRNSASTGQPKTNSTAASAAVTRPRRVGANAPTNSSNQSQTSAPASIAATDETAQAPQGPPVLTGSEPSAALKPPTLGKAGEQPATTNDGNSSEAAKETGPEEVEEGDVVRVDTSLVTVPVSVLDRQGRFVPNLKREDFRVFENGVEQPIAYFEPAEKPFTVALLLDTSASTHFHLQDIRDAAIAFAKQLRPQDKVLIVSFNDEVLLLTEVTNDMNLIETVIDENANTGNSTRLYDAVDLTIRERLNKIKGRKAIVLFTDGVDTSSQDATYESTLAEVDELDALIYPVQYDTTDYLNAMQGNVPITVTTTHRGIFGSTTSTQTYNVPMNNGQPLPGATKADYDRADRYLHALADKTGGRLYQANDNSQLADAFARIAEELRRQYSLGYYPKTDNADNGRRQIRVKVRQPNLAVKARDSYVKSSAAPNK